MKKILVAAAIASFVLTGCGTTSANSSAGNSTKASGHSKKPSVVLTNKNWGPVETDANKYKGDKVKVIGQIFTNPLQQKGETQYQLYLDPQNSNENVLAIVKGSPVAKNNDYVEITGKIDHQASGKNAMGATLNLPLIDAISVKKISRDVMYPEIFTVKNIKAQTQHKLTIKVSKVEFSKNETRIYLSVTNHSGSSAMISDYEAALIQGSTQIKQKNMFNSPYPTLPSQISNGVTAKTVLVYGAANAHKPLKFRIKAMTNNFNQTFHAYTFSVK